MRVIGALRGRSFDFFGLEAVVCDVVEVPAAAVGLLFCASPSRSLMFALSFLSHGADGGHVCDCWPAILVSGMPSFLGGGISGCNVRGREVSVISGRLDDCRTGVYEENGAR